jgi:hypothetical protein
VKNLNSAPRLFNAPSRNVGTLYHIASPTFPKSPDMRQSIKIVMRFVRLFDLRYNLEHLFVFAFR